MLGSNEIPAVPTTATGFASITLAGHLLTVDVSWTGLIGGTPAAAHIHCCVARGTNVGVAVGFPGFPTTLAGSYLHTFDLTDASIYTSAFRTTFGGGTAAGAEAALIAGLNADMAYVNIHDATWPGGEIRANVTAVPEPASLILVATGMLGLGSVALRKRRAA